MRHDIVTAAQGWIGKPYRHQATTRGAGCDCLGLLRGVWREVQAPEPAQIPPYSMDWSEPDGDEALWRAALAYLIPVSDLEPGDVVLFRMRDGCVAKHLGLVATVGPAPSFIHAYSGHGVVESAMTLAWARRIVARFRFPQRRA